MVVFKERSIMTEGRQFFRLLEWLKRYLFGVNCQKFYSNNDIDLGKGVEF